MKNILLILSLALSVTLFGQSNKEYYILELNTINDAFSKRLESYATNISHEMSRNSTIDSVAKIRNSYFISVMQETSNNGKTFNSMIDSIPHGKIGHTECFGKPTFFNAPKIIYPELFITIPELKLKISSEIMYQVTWQNTLSEYQNSKIILINKAIKEIKETYKVDKLSQKILGEYQQSTAHNKIIKEKGNGEYGASTLIIISEEKLKNGKWFYELMIRNVVIFTKKEDV